MKARTPQEERVLDIADPLANELGMEIVRIRVETRKTVTVQIMAECHDGTMNVDDCAKLSRAVSDVFEVSDPVGGPYNLEVSSPGIDRPLTALNHFQRWAGFEAKLELDRLVEGQKRFRGTLSGTDNETVMIDLKGEAETALIPFEWISDAKLVLTDALISENLKGQALSPAGPDHSVIEE